VKASAAAFGHNAVSGWTERALCRSGADRPTHAISTLTLTRLSVAAKAAAAAAILVIARTRCRRRSSEITTQLLHQTLSAAATASAEPAARTGCFLRR